MVRLLGIGAKGDDCPIQARTVRRLESERENIDFTRISEAMSAPAHGRLTHKRVRQEAGKE